VTALNTTESTPDLPGGSGVSVSVAGGDAPTRSVPPSGSRAGRRRARQILLALTPLLLFGVIAWVDFPLCPFRALIGVDCPGCGLTRATEAMLHLHLMEMLRLHPLAPIFAPLVLVTLLRGAARSLGHPLPELPFRVPNVVWIGLTAALLGLWVLRLAGYLGGTPDPSDPSSGLLGQLWNVVAGS